MNKLEKSELNRAACKLGGELAVSIANQLKLLRQYDRPAEVTYSFEWNDQTKAVDFKEVVKDIF